MASLQWVNEDWLLFSLRDEERLRGVYRGPGLLAMRRDGSDLHRLIDRDLGSASLVSLGRPGTLEVLLGYACYSAAGEHMHTRPRAVDISSGKSRIVYDDDTGTRDRPHFTVRPGLGARPPSKTVRGISS